MRVGRRGRVARSCGGYKWRSSGWALQTRPPRISAAGPPTTSRQRCLRPNGPLVDVGTSHVGHSIDDKEKYVAHYRFPRPKFTKRSAVSGADRRPNDSTEHIMSDNRKKSVTYPLREAVAAAVPALLTFGAGPSRTRDDRSRWHLGNRRAARSLRMAPIYQVTDRRHEGRSVYVPCHEIGTTVSAWLAELGAQSHLVEDLERAVDDDDWPTAHGIGDRLSVEVTHWARRK